MAKKDMELRLGSSECGWLPGRLSTDAAGGGEGIHFLACNAGGRADGSVQPVSQCGSQSGALRVRLVNLVVDRI